jgi:hypothetical protein
LFIRLLVIVGFACGAVSGAEPAKTTSSPARSSVAVIFALKSLREHPVAWHRTLTVHAAIEAAAPASRAGWRQAWRYRESFWTRTFPDPHSFWARLLAGEKATGYTLVSNAANRARSLDLQPGDRIYVDLAPIN